MNMYVCMDLNFEKVKAAVPIETLPRHQSSWSIDNCTYNYIVGRQAVTPKKS